MKWLVIFGLVLVMLLVTAWIVLFDTGPTQEQKDEARLRASYYCSIQLDGQVDGIYDPVFTKCVDDNYDFFLDQVTK